MTTSARKNQNGINKAKTRASTGCVTANSKAIAVQRNATSGGAKCVGFICSLAYTSSAKSALNRAVA
jgi:hypothetical protein